MNVVELAIGHETALESFLLEFARTGETRIPAYFADPDWSHAEIVQRFAAWSQGEGLDDGWVPSTTLFLIDEGRILGVVNLRHRLNDFLRRIGGHVGFAVRPSARNRGHGARLLEAAKLRAREMKIERLLVTCDEANAASSRVIEKCGGLLSDIQTDEASGERTMCFWIDL
ncbi:GNAT family N-acetyltransferase [Candidatus Bipolaricaulota bacterium]